MSSIVERVKGLDLPLDEVVVIGSGLLDAYGLREASDVDLVVSNTLFDTLKHGDQYTSELRHEGTAEVLLDDQVEIWNDWGKDLSYEALAKQALTIQGVRFAHPDIIIERKQQRGTEKDLNDVRMLKEYLNEQ